MWRTFKIFWERSLNEYLVDRRTRLINEVNIEEKDKLLNMNETAYSQYLIEKYRVDPLVFYLERMTVSGREEDIPAENFPPTFNVYAGKTYRRQVIRYHIPFSGHEDLLHCSPSSRLLLTYEVGASNGMVYFDIVSWGNDPETIKSEADERISLITQQAINLNKDIDEFDRSLDSLVAQVVRERREQLLQQSNMLASLGVPFLESDQVPPTFSVPIQPRKVVLKPPTSNEAFRPDPSLDDEVYRSILRIVYDTGVTMERHPSIYRGREEEALRDYILMMLTPHFESVTGETFNKQGKTDILIRHDNKNVFVAECKFWKGMQSLHNTIDQILDYLTWRDSKAAVICFIRNLQLNPVLEQIKTQTQDHACFVKYHGEVDPGYYKFEFHLKHDPTRGVNLAIICFHVPSGEE